MPRGRGGAVGGRAGRRARAEVVLVIFALAAAAQAAVFFARPLDAADLPHRPLDYRIDLNTADAATLELLPGIGPEIARRVVAHRESVGGFETVQALRGVRGVGPVTLRRVLPYIEPITPGAGTSP